MQGLIDHVYQSMFLRILPTSSSSHNEKNLIQRIHLWQGLLNWASWYLVASQQVPWGIAVGTLAHLAMWLSSRFEAHLRSQNNQPEPNIYGNVWCRMQVVKDANLFFSCKVYCKLFTLRWGTFHSKIIQALGTLEQIHQTTASGCNGGRKLHQLHCKSLSQS